ncbi:protein of unknown function [Paracoccus alcaliphilus]|uniref:DUF4174 domain-containing protein n=1 Tax=Paracoccus alcaliphilus TaxID=34002 RepID=A0A1H8JI50_9RHOB|nr:DUF4174 domain-containing protein [Paracoccus alcaliphilus]WCR18177.1 DUF4174 domain-containing protein [Paracoccus alcaliphilus]SEN80362.1 protein of unknown function [Paracoccus alcaliphilus]
MKLKFLMIVMALAAMGPSRDAPPPEPQTITPRAERARPASPEELAGPSQSDEAEAPQLEYDAAEVTPADFLWRMRPVVVFADTPDDPAFVEQMRALRRQPAMLLERDVVVIADADPAASSIWRQQLHPRGFSLVVMDKDGQVKQRKPLPWDVREISRAIDRFPLRRQEIGRATVLP